MLKGNGNVHISNESVMDWMINDEPSLVKKIYEYFIRETVEVSFDTEENSRRLKRVTNHIQKNSKEIYAGLTLAEKLLLYVMQNSFGWIVYENIDSTLNIVARVFRVEYAGLREAVDTLFKKFLIFKFERLKRYNLLFSPPVVLKSLEPLMEGDRIMEEGESCENVRESLSTYQYIALIAGFISYVITYSPRSSETNEIHKIDFSKMVDFFSDFAPANEIEKVIKKLSRFGFFEKLNNRIVINKSILDKIMGLSINEQLFIIFLYDFMDKFDFKKSYFMTLKILAHQKKVISLRELFFYYLNNEIYLRLKNEVKNLKLLLQQEELKFTFFVKTLESENIAVVKRVKEETVSIASDTIAMNEPHTSLLNSMDFSPKFKEKHFIVEPNYEIIVEPYLRPDILFKLALIAEPVTIQTISIFKITRESIYRSFAYGVRKKEITQFLKKHSRHEVPENVVRGIDSFINNLEIRKLDEYSIIQFNSQDSPRVRENFKNRMIEIEPHTFLVFDKEVLQSIENFCKTEGIGIKNIEDFLQGKDFLYKTHESNLVQNIRHLHTMKEFFDFYGSSLVGTGVKIDNEI